ncbi:MAG: hypothetical protein IJU52_00315 [Clostridia bacterium]|nr:hypothetical protein [Clostridia bacterium]
MKKERVVSFFSGLFLFLFWSLSSFFLSLPAWILLILHFVANISILWFWGALAAWLIIRFLRYLIIRYARWGAGIEEEEKKNENKNPYSHKSGQGKY